MDRRHFNALAGGSLASLLTARSWAAQTRHARPADTFYIALVADTHIIDTFYKKGSENGVEDNESILVTTPRFVAARDLINSLKPAIEQVFLVGDFFHNYPSTDYDFYFQNTTRLDNAKAIADGFEAPVHLGFGNHDYDVHRVPREMSHRLFEAKFNAKPYSSVDYKGWKFMHLNNFLGNTQDRTSADFNPSIGSLGEQQLQWFEAELKQNKATVVFIHYPLIQNVAMEFSDYGLHPLLRKYQANIQVVISGHVHKWIDYAHTYGPQHYIMASTRYDPNGYMLMQIDTRRNTWRFMNSNLVEWSTYYSKPYRQA